MRGEVFDLSTTWIVIISIAATLGATMIYRLSPFYDPGFAIWSTPDEAAMREAVDVFKRFGSRTTFDFSDEAVKRQAFANGFDVVNCALDPVMKRKLAAIYAARAFPTRNPHRAARKVAIALKENGQQAAAWFDPDPNVRDGYMAFVIVEGQGWMYVFRRRKFAMMIAQKRPRRS
jgi:hypothetical protein